MFCVLLAISVFQDGVTALHIAVYNKHSAVTKVLARKGDPEVLNACDLVC